MTEVSVGALTCDADRKQSLYSRILAPSSPYCSVSLEGSEAFGRVFKRGLRIASLSSSLHLSESKHARERNANYTDCKQRLSHGAPSSGRWAYHVVWSAEISAEVLPFATVAN